MATIKIILENGECEHEVREDLVKALSLQDYGGKGKFDDTVLDQLEQSWVKKYNAMLRTMAEEIQNKLAGQ